MLEFSLFITAFIFLTYINRLQDCPKAREADENNVVCYVCLKEGVETPKWCNGVLGYITHLRLAHHINQ